MKHLDTLLHSKRYKGKVGVIVRFHEIVRTRFLDGASFRFYLETVLYLVQGQIAPGQLIPYMRLLETLAALLIDQISLMTNV